MNLWLYSGWFEPGDFGRVTLVLGSLSSAADTCTPEEVVGVVGLNSAGGENLNACRSCSDKLACSEACCRVYLGVDSKSDYH